MIRRLLTAGLCAAALPALAADFAVGDRVHIGSTGKNGVVLAVGEKMMNGGTNIKVHVDGAAYPPNVGLMYDTVTYQVTVIGHGAAPGPAMAMRQAPPLPANIRPEQSYPPGKVAPNQANCQQAIRANYPATGDDQIVNVNFQAFQITGSGTHEAILAQDKMLGARGHQVRSLAIYTKFQVLRHFESPNADDQLRTFEGRFECYNSATTGDLVIEETQRLPGSSEHATYIRKN
jgi:hypothetical protein